jgi:APA family basic amino acid/polyamine antiporter
MPSAPRPYKVWGYPFTPALFVAFSLVFLLNTLISDAQNARMGLVLVFSGVPLYFYMKWKARKSNTGVVRLEEK